MIKEGSQIGVS